MYSVCDDLTAGFPHSEICGSKCVCSLPAAYRKLLRPSSPVIAKASTMCTYSLVSITLAPHVSRDRHRQMTAVLFVDTYRFSTLSVQLCCFQLAERLKKTLLLPDC